MLETVSILMSPIIILGFYTKFNQDMKKHGRRRSLGPLTMFLQACMLSMREIDWRSSLMTQTTRLIVECLKVCHWITITHFLNGSSVNAIIAILNDTSFKRCAV